VPSRQKCPKGCTCKKHQKVGAPCQPDCTCARHTLTDEQRQNLGVAMKSLWEDPGYRQKVHEGRLGRHFPEEVRQKISKKKRGIRPDGQPAVGVSVSDGYRILTGQQGHPLAGKMGNLPEHRKVLYEKIGSGPHPCHWHPVSGCGQLNLQWGNGIDGIFADHLDEDRLNNDPHNLVPSCHKCNWDRGKWWFGNNDR
jgi:hypothetical protein